MISQHPYALLRPCNGVARPILVFTAPLHLQRVKSCSRPSLWAASHNPQPYRLSPSRTFCHSVRPQTTGGPTLATVSSPAHVDVASTTIGVDHPPFLTSCTLVCVHFSFYCFFKIEVIKLTLTC